MCMTEKHAPTQRERLCQARAITQAQNKCLDIALLQGNAEWFF